MKDDCITQILIASLIHGSIKGWEKKGFELGSESLNTGRVEAGGEGKGRGPWGRGPGFSNPDESTPYRSACPAHGWWWRSPSCWALPACGHSLPLWPRETRRSIISPGNQSNEDARSEGTPSQTSLFARYTKDSMTSTYWWTHSPNDCSGSAFLADGLSRLTSTPSNKSITRQVGRMRRALNQKLLTRNITASHGMKNLAPHGLLRWRTIIPLILTASLMHFYSKRLGEWQCVMDKIVRESWKVWE